MFSAFKNFYLFLKFRFTPRFVVKNITFRPRSRYRKIPPAAVANQIAGKDRIPPAHERKKKIYYGKKIEKKIGTFKASAFVEYFR